MFLSDVQKQDECRTLALHDLQKLGVKCRPRKPKQHVENIKAGNKVFKAPLGALPTQIVTIKTGQQIAVPKLVHELCSFILTKVSTEGIFRKEGSKSRQNEIKTMLNSGRPLDKEYQVIDVAVVLKIFLRELPEPLIPYSHHELFLQSVLLEKNVEALLLACLLLPLEHLNTLAYLVQFFHEVTENSKKNKMDAYNLSVVVGPNVIPIQEKLAPNVQARTTKTCQIFQILIENSDDVGILPEDIITRLSTNCSGGIKKKKRRSGSLTRMFNGLKKIVGGKSVEENHNIVTPDLLVTPINNMKKRRTQNNGIPNKKKKELLSKLPDNVLLNTPFTPQRTPICMNLSGRQEEYLKVPNQLTKERKWFSRSRSVKSLKQEALSKRTQNAKPSLERRWSALAPSNNLKKTKKRSSYSLNKPMKTEEENATEPDYIRVPKTEYEAIKNRVSAMERRISIELESVQSQIKTDDDSVEVDDNIQNVQTVYEQTLVQAEHLSPTTDQLAKRLSRELKIRRSAEQKIIRSPSARKIGSMRRKSKELEKNNARLTRHQSWHVTPSEHIPRVSLKRGKPNTVLTGLPFNKFDGVMETKELKKTIDDESLKTVSCNLSGSSSDTWVSAEGFFATLKSNNSNSFDGRASLAKLRSQNAGMVLAKARLFDKLKDSDSSNSSLRSIPRPKISSNKIGSVRNVDSRLSYRIRTLKCEDKRLGKKSMSPRRRNLTQKQKLQIAKQYLDTSSDKNSDKENIPESFNNSDKNIVTPFKDCNRIDGYQILSPKFTTPKGTPHIKKTLNVRSPKRLCRTPGGIERSTPLRALKTPLHHHI